MAKMLIPFDMTVIYYNRKEISPKPDFPCEYVSSQEELLKRSDVVSLNLPLNAKTERSFGKAQFDQMKNGSVLINTARGAVVDEEAFLEALDSGKVSFWFS
jgi:glyoxylate reductase